MKHLPAPQIFACFCVPMYDPMMDRIVVANDDFEDNEFDWIYAGIQRKPEGKD